jgi:hypothetical protein
MEPDVMELGDTVTVRTTGRRARLIEALDKGRYVVEFLPDPMTDPIDRDTTQSEDEGGVYSTSELEPFR